jgi:uncharacterized protein (TIGR03067 family)
MDPALRELQGAWRAVKLEVGGATVRGGSVGPLMYVFEGDRISLIEGETNSGVGTVTLDAAREPKAMGVAMTAGPGKGQTARGIDRVVGGRLTLCIGEERPHEFRGAGPAALVELVRQAEASPSRG